MIEFFQQEMQEQARLEEEEVNELISVVDELASLEEYTEENPPTAHQLATTVRGIALMCFRGGRAYEHSLTDDQFVTVHLPVDKAGKFIEMLLEG